jgi:hypothetical protein
MQKVVGEACRHLTGRKAMCHIFFPGRYHGKKREKYVQAWPFSKTFTLSKTLHHIKFPISPLIRYRCHGKKREKYGQAFPFSKPLH